MGMFMALNDYDLSTVFLGSNPAYPNMMDS